MPDEVHLRQLARALLLQQVCNEVAGGVADGGRIIHKESVYVGHLRRYTELSNMSHRLESVAIDARC